MIIKSVKLENFLSHKCTMVDFDRGVNIIVGPNGAGKTSIVDAIIFALFSDRVRGDKKDDIIRKGSKDAKVELKFEVGDKGYIIINKKSKTKNEVIIYEDGKTIATSNKAVVGEVAKILGMDKEIALNSIFVRQGEISSLLDQEPSKRKEITGKLIGLDKLEYTYDKLKDVINLFKEEMKEYGNIKGRIDEKRRYLEERCRKRENLEEEMKEKKRELDIGSKELEDAKEDLALWEKKRSEYNELDKKLSLISSNIENIEKDIGRLNGDLNSAREADEKAREMKDKIGKLELLEKDKEFIEKEEQLKKDKERLEDELMCIDKILNEIEDSKEGYEEYNRISKRLEDMSREEESLKGSEIEDERINAKIEEKKKEVGKIERDGRELGITTLEDKKSKLEAVMKMHNELKETIDELKDENSRLNGRRKEVKGYLNILGENSICPICKQELTEEHREDVKREFEEEIMHIKSRLGEIKEDIVKKNDEINILENREKEIERLDVERLTELKDEIKNLASEKERISKDVIKLAHIRDEIKDIKSRLKELKVYYDNYIGAEKALKSIRSKEEIESELKDVNNKISDIENSKSILEDKIGIIPEDLDSEIRILKKVEKEYTRLKTIASNIELLEEEINKKVRRVEEKRREKDGIEHKLRELMYSDEEYKKVRDRRDEISKGVTKLEERINSINSQLTILEEEISKSKAEIKELEEEIGKLEGIKELINNLEIIRKAFSKDGIQKAIRRKIAPLVSDLASEYLDEFNLELTSISINEDFDITLMRGGTELSLKNISGGEKVAAAIALRLAIANAISNRLSTIIMDEPTVYLDEERRRELVDIMRSFSTNSIIPQLIIITHNRELEDVGDVVCNVRKENGISDVECIDYR